MEDFVDITEQDIIQEFLESHSFNFPKNLNVNVVFPNPFAEQEDLIDAIPQGTRRKFLEIGAFEGMGTAIILQCVLGDTDTLEVVDPWSDSEDIYDRFVENMDEMVRRGYSTPTIHRGTSREILPTLTPNTYDYIYVDGSHATDDVRFDIQNSWRLLKVSGVLVCDDYDWAYNTIYECPKTAIDEFLLNNNDAEIIYTTNSIAIRKLG